MSDKPLLPVDSNVPYKIKVTFGHIVMRNWFECRGGRLVGMGEAVHFDADGVEVKREVIETGVSAVLA